MIERLKVFWNDLSDLPKWRFFCKYVLPVLVIFFNWGLIGHLSLLALRTKSLIANRGQVVAVGVRPETSAKGHTYNPLIISLFNSTNNIQDQDKTKQLYDLLVDFRLKDDFISEFALIQYEIQKGDTITIYTRKKWQTLLGMGRQHDIYQIEKNNQVLFSIQKMIDYQKNQTIAFGLFAFASSFGYLIYRWSRSIERKRIAEQQQ